MEVRVGPPNITIHADDEFAVCALNAEMSSTEEQGFFAADTRLVSGYRIKLGRTRPVLRNSSAIRHHSARFEFTNPALVGGNAEAIAPDDIHLRLDRSIGHGMHEDYDLTNYSRQAVAIDLEVSIESDFADLFDVKAHRNVRRGSLESTWEPNRLVTRYHNGTFERGVAIAVESAGSPPEFANGGISFRISIEPGQSWHTCLLWQPILEGKERNSSLQTCRALTGPGNDETDRIHREWVSHSTTYTTSEPAITASIRQAVDDLAGMRMHRHGVAASGGSRNDPDAWIPAAGIPWFVSLFGRDSLIVSLQTSSLSPRFALGTLRALATLQADGYDDARDMQPGKIEHEIRHGELAALHLIPHTPYYGTHEATTLYVLVAAQSWAWHGDRIELDRIRPHVERALAWIDTDGDIDGDGLQEYRTRSPHGYYNQGWKDAGDAIVGSDAKRSLLPIALCEHQGLVVAAKRAWADISSSVFGEEPTAARLRGEANRLAELIETRFWWEEEGTYFLGLDGDKAPIRSVASNPGYLLWHNVVQPERAVRVARRLLAPDMWSGWGIRTLSADHVAYNPFSYQLGSVWPHDNAFAVAGFRNYGLDAEAAQVAKALFDAAGRFASNRLPELFSGLARDEANFPVQYLGANVPQAWASGAIIHLVTALIGLHPDAQNGVLRLRPGLPEWMSRVTLRQLRIGDTSVDFSVTRQDDGGHELEILAGGNGLEVEIVD